MVPSKEELYRLYVKQRLTTRAIAARYGTNKTQVTRWLKRVGIERRDAHNGLLNRGITPPTRDELYQLVHVEHLPYQQIAARWGVDYTAIPYWLDRHGIARPTIWGTRRKGNNPILPTKEELEALYADGLSMAEIGRRCGVSRQPIQSLFEKYSLDPRPDGFQGGRRWKCRDGHEVRSSYEQKVDDWLFEHQIEHLYSPRLPFDLRSSADFLANGWYIEVWGVTDNASYRERQKRKRSGYILHRLPLIEIPAHAFDRQRNGLWKRRLAPCLSLPPEGLQQFSLEI
jgi:transcriptional regulator with XRE-family HTH domain